MPIKQYIVHLQEVAQSDINNSEKKIVDKILAVLHYVESMNLTATQEEDINKLVHSLNLKTYRGGNKRVIIKKLNQLTDFLKTEYAIISEGYYMSLGIALGSAFGLSIGSMASTMGFEVSNGVSFGLIIGMVVGLLIGNYMDDSAKKKGKVITSMSD